MVAEYYVAVGDGIMRALRDRPTALERWPKGVREGIVLSTGYGDKADAFYQKRVPKGAPDYVETATITFPSGRTADEVCPTEVAVPAWAAQMGTLTFHPWPVRRDRPDHPDELRIDLDPHGATGFRDAVRVAGVARDLLDDLGLVGFPKTSGNRGVHVYVRIEPRWDFVDVRHAAIAFGRELERRTAGVTTNWWKEERGDSDLRGLQPELPRPHHRLGLQPAAQAGRAGLHADGVGRARRGRGPARLQPLHRARAVRRARRRARGHRRRARRPDAAARPVRRAGRRSRCPTRPTTRRCPASRRACSPARRSPRTGTSRATASRPALSRAAAPTGLRQPGRSLAAWVAGHAPVPCCSTEWMPLRARAVHVAQRLVALGERVGQGLAHPVNAHSDRASPVPGRLPAAGDLAAVADQASVEHACGATRSPRWPGMGWFSASWSEAWPCA